MSGRRHQPHHIYPGVLERGNTQIFTRQARGGLVVMSLPTVVSGGDLPLSVQIEEQAETTEVEG